MRDGTRALVPVLIAASLTGCGGSSGGGGGSASWRTTTIDGTVSIRSISIALDAAGQPHVAYLDLATNQLLYASRAGGTWTRAVIPNTTHADEQVALVLDGGGHPHVAWQSDNGTAAGGIRYAFDGGSGWTVETVESAVVGARVPGLSLALTSGGVPSISFYGGDGFGLKYATRGGAGTWGIATVDAAAYAGFHGTSLVFDAADHPVLSYFTYDYLLAAQALRLARYDGTAWTIQIVDSGEGVGEWSSLALDGAGHPRLAYLDTLAGTVKYAASAGTSWSISTVAPGYIASLALAADGTPWIGFGETAGSWLKLAHLAGSTWSVETLPASVDWTLSLAVDPSGGRHLAHDKGSTGAATFEEQP